ncbi:MAG: hypothetical protein R3D32_11065 [Nitratireductor sp.]
MMIVRIEMLIRKSLDTPAATDFVYRNKVYVAARRAWRDNARRREIPEDRIDAFLREIENCIENIELEFQLGSSPEPELPPLQSARLALRSPVERNTAKREDSGRKLGPFADPEEWPEPRDENLTEKVVTIPPPARKRWKLLPREKLALAVLLLLSVSAALMVLLR